MTTDEYTIGFGFHKFCDENKHGIMRKSWICHGRSAIIAALLLITGCFLENKQTNTQNKSEVFDAFCKFSPLTLEKPPLSPAHTTREKPPGGCHDLPYLAQRLWAARAFPGRPGA